MFDKKFTLTFKIDNDAFVEDKFAEVALTLNQIAKSVKKGEDIGRIWDKNGNLIGEWYFE